MSAVLARRMLVLLMALLLAAQVVRNAAVVALAPLQPDAAARLWAGHPDVELSQGMAEIGAAARAGSKVRKPTFARIDDAAVKAPLAPEPFLVRGVEAQTGGKTEAAQQAFLDAQWRDPRSVPAAYFLANYYLRSGDVLEGLEQTALLTRLVPEAAPTVAPYVAAYARDRSTWRQMRAFFRTERYLQEAVLVALAQDAANADAILALADASHRKPESTWLPVLVKNLVDAGDYAKAHAVWSTVGGGRGSGDLIYDPGFSAPKAPPPFNWSLVTATTGLAERQPGGRLHVLFYGNQDGVLASQLLLLAPGTYRLQMSVVGAPANPELLKWSMRCNDSKEPFATLGINGAGTRSVSFRVPSNCPAQWIELSGRSGDVSEQSEVTIRGLSLTRVRPSA
jgi:hypothetical protein